jgi:hypothetical protein
MASKTMTGARAVISVDNQVVGLYESCTYGANLGHEPIHILGRFGADEIAVTSYEAISVNCSGFRVIGQGVHVLPKMPRLQDLLNLGTVTISIKDRQTGDLIMTVTGAVPVAYNGGVNARATSRVSVTYTGTKLSDESGDQEESGAVSLP